jgi:glyceraldehyde 3-phosphate dehydrogenase
MSIKLGINGFGRIGRLTARAALEMGDVEIVGINDLADNASLAHLFKYDSTHGTLDEDVEFGEEGIVVGGRSIPVFSEKNPAKLPWDKVKADIVIESTGFFSKRADAACHLKAGAGKVIISQPSPDADKMIVMGVNHHEYDDKKHHVVSNASCTTNCLAPIVKVLHDHFGLVRGLMTTIHSYTNDQRTLDQIHSDPRRMRAAALSIIPTKTGAAAAIGRIIPEIDGRLDGYALRVPTPNVSATDLTAELEKSVTAEEINQAFSDAARSGDLKGILGYTNELLVSCDFNHSSYSSIIDGATTRVLHDNFIKVLSWYDNEWGYSMRCLDLARLMSGSVISSA